MFNHKNYSGRNNSGRIVVRRRGAGNRSLVVSVNSYKFLLKSYGVLVGITCSKTTKNFLGLIKYTCGAFAYQYIPHGSSYGSLLKIQLSECIKFTKIILGTTTCLIFLSTLTLIFNVKVFTKTKIQFAKAAGTFCQILEIDFYRNKVLIELPTKIRKWVNGYSIVTTGRSANILKQQEVFGNAGLSRVNSKRPAVRGVAMNPVDHPHGGRTKTNSPEVTPWGKIAKYNR